MGSLFNQDSGHKLTFSGTPLANQGTKACCGKSLTLICWASVANKGAACSALSQAKGSFKTLCCSVCHNQACCLSTNTNCSGACHNSAKHKASGIQRATQMFLSAKRACHCLANNLSKLATCSSRPFFSKTISSKSSSGWLNWSSSNKPASLGFTPGGKTN